MRFKIQGGTASDNEPSLCLSCRYATIVRGPRLRDEMVDCQRLSGDNSRITFHVRFCSAYVDRTHPTLHQMEEIAWVLRSDPKRNQIGFVRARALKPHDRYVLDDEWA
jgi:hypothetical protein